MSSDPLHILLRCYFEEEELSAVNSIEKKLRELMGDVAVAALDALIGKYGVGFNTGQLRFVPDEETRRFLRERFGGGSSATELRPE